MSHFVNNTHLRAPANSAQEQLEEFVQPFLDLVKAMYVNTKAAVEKEFGTPSGPPKSAVSTLIQKRDAR